VDFFNSLIRWLVEAYVGLFGAAHPLVSLIPLSILVGIGMLWVFGKTSDQKAIARQKKKVQAYLLELRLFGDDPGLLWKSQIDLVVGNLRYMGLMLKPALYLTLPMVVLLFHLDAVYGISALPVGESAVVTVHASGRLAETAAAPQLEAPEGVVVETAAMRALDAGEFSWRVRAQAEAEGELQFDWNGQSWSKSVTTGDSLRYVSHNRPTSMLDSLAAPGEPRLAVPQLDSVEIAYPGAEIDFAAYRLHWLVWFFVVSLVAAYLLKGFFGVTI